MCSVNGFPSDLPFVFLFAVCRPVYMVRSGLLFDFFLVLLWTCVCVAVRTYSSNSCCFYGSNLVSNLTLSVTLGFHFVNVGVCAEHRATLAIARWLEQVMSFVPASICPASVTVTYPPCSFGIQLCNLSVTSLWLNFNSACSGNCGGFLIMHWFV